MLIDICRACNDVSGIYQLECSASSMVYIGRSESIGIRVMAHIYILRANTHYNKKLQAAFNKHGEKCFSFSILEEVRPEDLIARESAYIKNLPKEKLYNKHYSSNTGATSGISQETRNKQSIRQKAEKNHFYGRKHSQETISLMKMIASNRKLSKLK